MGRKPKIDATRMPVIHTASNLDCFAVVVSDAVMRWVCHNKRYYFRFASDDEKALEIPRMVRFSSSGKKEFYFLVEKANCVGPEIIRKNFEVDGGIGAYIIFELSLSRLSRGKADWYMENAHNTSYPIADINDSEVEKFAVTPLQIASLTHWIANPVHMEDAPYTREACEMLPRRIVELCRQNPIGTPGNPFSRKYIRNWDLQERHPKTFTFIDLFAGIGGFRIAMQNEGGKCTFASEINVQACDTYRRNFGDFPFGDITADETKNMIPAAFDVLCGGFPCQAFSFAGLRKGFEDARKRGTLYRQVVNIAAEHNPKVIFCENVKGLLNKKLRYQDGVVDVSAIEKIHEDLENAGPGYRVVYQNVLDSADFGVAQHRERLYIVAVRSDIYAEACRRGVDFVRCLEAVPRQRRQTIGDIRERRVVEKCYYIGQSYLETLKRHREKHRNAGHGFGFEVKSDTDIASTLMCGGMGKERNLIKDDNQLDWEDDSKKGGINREHYRFMTIAEWRDLQGFPKNFSMPANPTAGYRQFGNCVTVNAVQAIGAAILDYLRRSGGEI